MNQFTSFLVDFKTPPATLTVISVSAPSVVLKERCSEVCMVAPGPIVKADGRIVALNQMVAFQVKTPFLNVTSASFET